MKIQYLGHSSFLLQSEGTSLVTDPFGDIGIPFPARLHADGVTVSHHHYDHCNLSTVSAPAVFGEAGSYRVGGVTVTAVKSFHDDRGGALRGTNLIFRFEAESMTLVHLGDLGEPLSEELLTRIGRADVLFVPVGGHYTIDAQAAERLVRAVRPAIAVPMHYYVPGLTVDIAGVEPFLERFPGAEKRAVLELTREKLPKETKIIWMERMG